MREACRSDATPGRAETRARYPTPVRTIESAGPRRLASQGPTWQPAVPAAGGRAVPTRRRSAGLAAGIRAAPGRAVGAAVTAAPALAVAAAADSTVAAAAMPGAVPTAAAPARAGLVVAACPATGRVGQAAGSHQVAPRQPPRPVSPRSPSAGSRAQSSAGSARRAGAPAALDRVPRPASPASPHALPLSCPAEHGRLPKSGRPSRTHGRQPGFLALSHFGHLAWVRRRYRAGDLG